MSISGVSDSNPGNSSGSTYSQASAAEREANHRIAAAAKQVEMAQKDAEENLLQVRDTFEKQYVAENARNDTILESQRFKTYEQIRDLQRAQQAEERKIFHEGERTLSRENDYYKNATDSSHRHAIRTLEETERQDARQLEATQSEQRNALEERKAQYEQQMTQLKKKSEDQLQQLIDDDKKQFEKMQLSYQTANLQTQEKFDSQLKNANEMTASTLETIYQKADQQLRKIREDTAFKISAYDSRQRDPFYQLVDIHAQIHDDGEAYILTATIPEYEQDHISVSVKGNHLVISGNRRNEENLELEHGHSVGSASFQSFHESFPLAWPVDPKLLTKVFDGDQLIARVPKKNEFAFHLPDKKPPETLRVEAPHFPRNIRQPKHENPNDDIHTGEKPLPLVSEKGSAPLD